MTMLVSFSLLKKKLWSGVEGEYKIKTVFMFSNVGCKKKSL